MAKEQTHNAQQSATVSEASASVTATLQPRPCPQDCRQCGINQQIFCTTKMLFDLSRRQQVLESAVAEIAKTLTDIQTQLQKNDEAEELSVPCTEGD